MPDRDHDKAQALVADVMARATVLDIRDAADALAESVCTILEPLPVLPLDPVARERVLALALLAKDQAARRLLALVVTPDITLPPSV
jgi:hypothetical protein